MAICIQSSNDQPIIMAETLKCLIALSVVKPKLCTATSVTNGIANPTNDQAEKGPVTTIETGT